MDQKKASLTKDVSKKYNLLWKGADVVDTGKFGTIVFSELTPIAADRLVKNGLLLLKPKKGSKSSDSEPEDEAQEASPASENNNKVIVDESSAPHPEEEK